MAFKETHQRRSAQKEKLAKTQEAKGTNKRGVLTTGRWICVSTA